jgi:hypothetical protein
MKIMLPVIFNQNDPRWAGKKINGSPLTFARAACLICCQAMVARYYGRNEDPATLHDKIEAKGGFKSDGSYYWHTVTKIFKDIVEEVVATPMPLTDDQIGAIKTKLDNGYPVICQIDYDPKDIDPDMHFVVFTGYNANDENDFTIADPVDGKEKSLKSYLGWFKPSVRRSIDRIVLQTGNIPEVTADTIVVTKKDYNTLMTQVEQWIKIVGYLLGAENDPKTTTFENCQSIVAGFKSTQTDLKTKLDVATAELAKATVEIDNQKDKVANVEAECQRSLKTQKAEYEAKISTMPDTAKLEGQYKGVISELEGKLRESQKTVGLRDLEIAGLKVQEEKAKLFDSIINFIKKLLGR